MKFSNDRIDQALDRLYDALAKKPEGTGFQLRLERYKKYGVRIPLQYRSLVDFIRTKKLITSDSDVLRLVKIGHTKAETARILGISRQRVHQIIKASGNNQERQP